MSEKERERCQDCGQIWEGWHVCMNMPATATATPAPPSDGLVGACDRVREWRRTGVWPYFQNQRDLYADIGTLLDASDDAVDRADKAERERDALLVALERIERFDCDGDEYHALDEGGTTAQWCQLVARAALDAGEGEG